MCYNAIQEGASGVDMGRNIFQSDNPIAMMKAVRGVVHENLKPQEGFDLYQTLKAEETEQPSKKGKEKAKA
jgi:putative autoinducer-2 (AI-2) aldolase